MLRLLVPAMLVLAGVAVPAAAADISTHVLDLAAGVGARGVPVTLLQRRADGGWIEVARAATDADGRVRTFGPSDRFAPGLYKLHFAMGERPGAAPAPFFPEVDITFRVSDAAKHYHVPIAASPFGYSTYRGN